MIPWVTVLLNFLPLDNKGLISSLKHHCHHSPSSPHQPAPWIPSRLHPLAAPMYFSVSVTAAFCIRTYQITFWLSTAVPSLGWEDPLEKGRATYSSILAWEIPWTRSLSSYSPWGRKEMDTTERLTLSLHLSTAV